MPDTLFKLAGHFFRPGGKLLFKRLPVGASMLFVPEPSNPYDENAIAGFMDLSLVIQEDEEIDAIMAGSGVDSESLSHYHCGYVAKVSTDEVRALGEAPWLGELTYDMKGNPFIKNMRLKGTEELLPVSLA